MLLNLARFLYSWRVLFNSLRTFLRHFDSGIQSLLGLAFIVCLLSSSVLPRREYYMHKRGNFLWKVFVEVVTVGRLNVLEIESLHIHCQRANKMVDKVAIFLQTYRGNSNSKWKYLSQNVSETHQHLWTKPLERRKSARNSKAKYKIVKVYFYYQRWYFEFTAIF